MKGDRIRHLGGKFIVVPSVIDFSIETIHCQTKLMGEYARVYMVKMVLRWLMGHKITKYDMTFVFWMVIDCLLKSKFVGYTTNFTENSDVIIDGADVFFQHNNSSSLLDVDNNNFFVEGIPGYFDPFVDNEINLDADDIPASKVLSNETIPLALSCKSSFATDRITSSASNTAFMTDAGPAFPSVAERFGWNHLLDCRHFALQILTAWHGISDPKQFQSDVYDILDTPSLATLTSFLKQAHNLFSEIFKNKTCETFRKDITQLFGCVNFK